MVRKTKQEALETRHRLLDAAEQLFHERGVSRTSLQDIATAAGVTRGAVYWHFEDKVELFTAMMDRVTLPLEEGLPAQSTSEAPLTLLELRWGLLNIFHTCSHSERARRVFEIAMKKVEFTGEMQALHERKLANHQAWRRQDQACFEAAQAAGQLPASLDAASTAIALVALVDGLLHQWIMDPSAFDLMRMGEAAIERFMNSLVQTGTCLLPPVTAEERARFGTRAICSPTADGQMSLSTSGLPTGGLAGID
jgi:TetR/AcrR family acrAB operon transcriptional repressor